MSSTRRYYIFVDVIYGLEEKNWKSQVAFAVPLYCLCQKDCGLKQLSGVAFHSTKSFW